MNPAAATAATRSTNPAANRPIASPRRARIASAIASVLVTGVLFGSVVVGLTSLGDDAPQVVAQARAGTPA